MTTLPTCMLEVGDGIYSIDVEYLRPGLAASHLLVAGDGAAAFVDTGTNSSVPRLLAALEALGLTPGNVRFVFLTHIHLDHAGGAGLLMRSLPEAHCVIHPRGARHMIDPVKLMAGTRAVYGDEVTAELYGEIVPIDARRVIEAADEAHFELGPRPLVALHTEGHARHHYCLHDPSTKSVFTGDSFGLSYRSLDTDQGPFVFPSTTPVHFDPPAAHDAIDRIMALELRQVYLTHYSRVADLPRLAADMHEVIDGFVAIALDNADADDRGASMREQMFDYLAARIEAHGFEGDREAIGDIINADVALNVQGLEVWLDRREP